MIKRNPTIEWADGKVRLIDQTLLPNEFKYVDCETVEDVWDAIKQLKVRGAPAIGIAGALGVVRGVWNFDTTNFVEFSNEVNRIADYLATSRPTAVNLFWALDRMKKTVEENKDSSIAEIKKILLAEAQKIIDEDNETCRAIGKNGSELIEDGSTVLTHCNAGGLATASYGTALAVIYAAQEAGKSIKVYADETRPLLQGARLTTFELMQAEIDVVLICDNMAAQVMKEGKIDFVIVGADRIASNGDAANKIGTYNVAILAKEHKIPFYVAAPISTFDMSLASGDEIPIEQRGAEEITEGFGKRTAPDDVQVYSPAFDVTPARLIDAIITEKSVIEKPSIEKINTMF